MQSTRNSRDNCIPLLITFLLKYKKQKYFAEEIENVEEQKIQVVALKEVTSQSKTELDSKESL